MAHQQGSAEQTLERDAANDRFPPFRSNAAIGTKVRSGGAKQLEVHKAKRTTN